MVIVILSRGTMCLYGEDAEANAPANPTAFRVESTLVLAPTLVTKKSGEIVYGLQHDDFVVRVNGREQPFYLDESPDSEKISVIVAVQIGGSASLLFENSHRNQWEPGNSILGGLGTLVENFVGAMDAEIAIVTFDSRVSLVHDFSDDIFSVKEKIDNLEGSGDSGAAILDAVNYAFRLFEESQQGRRHILFLISETRDHKSKTIKAETLAGKLASGNVQIHSVAFKPLKLEVINDLKSNKSAQNDDINFLPLIGIARNAMAKNAPRSLAEDTGGEQKLFSSRSSFDSIFVDLTNQFRSTYLISFQATDTGAGFHNVQVRLRSAQKDVVVRSRKGYRTD